MPTCNGLEASCDARRDLRLVRSGELLVQVHKGVLRQLGPVQPPCEVFFQQTLRHASVYYFQMQPHLLGEEHWVKLCLGCVRTNSNNLRTFRKLWNSLEMLLG